MLGFRCSQQNAACSPLSRVGVCLCVYVSTASPALSYLFKRSHKRYTALVESGLRCRNLCNSPMVLQTRLEIRPDLRLDLRVLHTPPPPAPLAFWLFLSSHGIRHVSSKPSCLTEHALCAGKVHFTAKKDTCCFLNIVYVLKLPRTRTCWRRSAAQLANFSVQRGACPTPHNQRSPPPLSLFCARARESKLRQCSPAARKTWAYA